MRGGWGMVRGAATSLAGLNAPDSSHSARSASAVCTAVLPKKNLGAGG